MGVHGLWDLLAPVGRRVSVETLAGKRLAIDASIWMIQFMKAMRDEKGEMVRNAHLLGFFRRICKLLYLRTKPVFIFDGGTPALKRRTVIARRRQRENAQAKIRKTAEKLLLNQLKQIRLKELAAELEKQRRTNDAKGKKVATDEAQMAQETSGQSLLFTDDYNQEALDEMLAASLAAEEDEGFAAAESSSGVGIQTEEEEGADEDEEMILPTMHGKIDPAILAALPPSMQLDLLVQMRERLMAENRQKYQRVKKAPSRFSELQIQAYLKTVAFRREIDEVQKSAAGRGVGGVQTSRIASEANREFIFSTNFSGNKQVLTSTGEGSKKSEQSQTAPVNPSTSAVNDVASKTKHTAVAGSTVDEPQRNFENDVETYLDERGRVRVSRVRAMGIRMTRDLQRNLDLMKEIDGESVCMTKSAIEESTNCSSVVDIPDNFSKRIPNLATCYQDSNGMTCVDENNEESILNAGTSMEISFDDNGQHELGGEDDDLFAHLVAGDPVMEFSINDSLSKKQSLDSTSEPEWEDGDIEVEAGTSNNKLKCKPLLPDGMRDENDLGCEDGSLGIQEEASFSGEYLDIVSKGALEEEADLKEAIRRSLQDLDDQRLVDTPDEDEKCGATAAVVSLSRNSGFIHKEVDGKMSQPPSTFNNQQHESPCHVQENTRSPASNIVETNSSLDGHLTAYLEVNYGTKDLLPEKACGSYPFVDPLMQDVSGNNTSHQEVCGTPVQEKDVSPFEAQLASGTGDGIVADGLHNGSEAEAVVDGHLNRTTEIKGASLKDLMIDTAQQCREGEVHECGEEHLGKDGSSYGRKEEARLEEEVLLLGEEQRELGDKQKKLERNAESVSSEMFAECQELLQMFGLPFIIAPMEAEAQCAFMELVNLVDGVVTDDSDAFLFGARNVCKNIFDDRKYVETYFMKDIENELGLNREKLIHMALLLGSDYTEGVSGIGIVNAIEVVNAFPEEDGLHRFREWIESPDPSILGKFDLQAGSSSKQIQSQVGETDMNCSDAKLSGVAARDADVSGSVDDTQKLKQIFMNKHRNVSKNWHIPSSFPSDAVISAYSSPQVDKSTEPFSWGKPDHFVLRKLCWEKFGWSTQKADELLLPVLKEYNKRETQLRLEAFYTFNERFANIRSKRIKKAVRGITGKKSLDLMDESVQDGLRSKKKRRNNQDVAAGDKLEEASSGQEYADVGNEAKTTEKVNETELRNIGSLGRPLHPGGGSRNRLPSEENFQGRSRGVTVRKRGKARGRGGASDHPINKGGIKSHSSEYSSSSPDDEIYSDSAQDVQVNFGEQNQVRRSRRPRKEVNYSEFNLKSDDPDSGDESSREGSGARKVSSADMLEDLTAAVPSKINESENLDQELSWEFLEKGDGYGVGKAKEDMGTDQLNSSPSNDIVSDTELSKEYLSVGGGFCLDEDTTDGDLQGSSKCPGKVTTFESDPSKCSGLGEDEISKSPTRAVNPVQAGRLGNLDTSYTTTTKNPDESANRDRSEVASIQEIISDDDYDKDSSRYFRAMPNLRRKRRKT
ncbi:DNA repair protein UVH3 isoform X1 [Coffea arabica]|uniref:DNA repair protein UVH3 isoform X1 n=4 Tax=Coffea arabica TaxID=13443 RepID=A0A6P6T8N2_COFAR|nr:DNA repair protein UVH3-like isoform X1 [Coffea arabica]